MESEDDVVRNVLVVQPLVREQRDGGGWTFLAVGFRLGERGLVALWVGERGADTTEIVHANPPVFSWLLESTDDASVRRLAQYAATILGGALADVEGFTHRKAETV